MPTPLVAGNWKMHGSQAMVAELLPEVLAGLNGIAAAPRVAVFPPYPYLQQTSQLLAGSDVAYGAQDVSAQKEGAYTGEVSADMLRDLGCGMAIVGHSERRQYHGESDALVAAKFAAVVAAGLQPILCVGETLEQREHGVTEQVVGGQLQAVIDKVGAQAVAAGIVAYEPVWAIGTGRTASSDQAQQVHAFIRDRLGAPGAEATILYGGSVKPENAGQLFAMPDIDGALVGGASLSAASFVAICGAAASS